MMPKNKLGRISKLGVNLKLSHPNLNLKGNTNIYTYIVRTPQDNESLLETLDGFVELTQPAPHHVIKENIA